MTDDREPVDVHSIRTLAENASAAAEAALNGLDLPEDSDVAGLVRVARDRADDIVRMIDHAEGFLQEGRSTKSAPESQRADRND